MCPELLARERGVLLSPVMLLPPWHGAQWPHVMRWWRLPRPPYRLQRLPVSRCNHRPMSDCLTRCAAQVLGSVALHVLTKAQRHLLLLVPCKVPACVV